MVEINFFSEFRKVLIPHVFVDLVSQFLFDSFNLDVILYLVDLTVTIKVVFWAESWRVFMSRFLHHEGRIILIVIIIFQRKRPD